MAAASSNVLSIILSVIFPPLGVAVHEGVTSRFWICLVLTLLFYLPGLIYALVVILK